jgi:hypothetical protein
MKMQEVTEESTQEYVMPCAEAVLMATLALMTGHAQNKNEQHLQWMAHKIGANLEILASHPDLSVGFKKALKRLVANWSQPTWGEASACTKDRGAASYLPAAAVIQ